MKPVNLIPSGGSIATKPGAQGQVVAIGAVMGVALVAVGGYLGYARVSDMKTQASSLSASAASATAQTSQLQQEIKDAGQTDDFSVAAKAAESSVLTSLSARMDVAGLARHIAAVTPPSVWYSSIGIENSNLSTDGAGSGSTPVTLSGNAPDLATLAALRTRLATVPELTDVEIGTPALASAKGGGTYVTFTLTAQTAVSSGASGTADGSTVADVSGALGSATSIALVPRPGFSATKAPKVAAPTGPAAKPKPAAKPLTRLQSLVQDTQNTQKANKS